MIKGFTEGRIVHFVLPSGEHRPAVIVRAWGKETSENGCANLQVLLDGTNDLRENEAHLTREDAEKGTKWVTSVIMDNDDKRSWTWHWIEPA